MVKIIDRRKNSMGGGSKRSSSQIRNIAVHYSATSSGNTASFERYWRGTRGWNTGGYHEVVLTNGDVELNYDASVISNGVGGQNSKTYNICYVGDGAPNAKQLESLKERVNYNRKRFNISASNVQGHREFSNQSTACPALNMNEFRKSLSNTSKNTSKPATSNSETINIEWVGTKNKGKRVEAIVPSVNFYDTQRWTNPSGSFKKGEGWTIVDLYRVNGSLQYRVQNSKKDTYYITARKDLVRVVNSSQKNGDLKTGSIVVYLNSIGVNSSYNHRKKLAKQYGIKGYRGTAAQNTKLLRVLRNR